MAVILRGQLIRMLLRMARDSSKLPKQTLDGNLSSTNMRRKLKVGILFGGRSVEHEVSLQSAKNIFAAIDRTKYIPVPVAVTKKGQWLILSDKDFLLNPNNPKTIKLNIVSNPDNLMPERVFSNGLSKDSQGKNFVDVVFPVLHGPFGEDGTVQGLLKLANVPFVGASVLGSAVGMDKDVMKRLLREAKLPVTDFITFFESDQKKIDYKEVVKRLGLPIFVKPASLGSSVESVKSLIWKALKKRLKPHFFMTEKF